MSLEYKATGDDQPGFRLAIVGGLVLAVVVVVGVCAGVGLLLANAFNFGRNPTAQQATQQVAVQEFAQAFVAEIRNGNAKEAYARTSKNYRSKIAPEVFRDNVAQWSEGLKPFRQQSLVVGPIPQGKLFAGKAVLIDQESNAKVVFEMEFVQENGEWKVERLAVDPNAS
jgi:hypothetical protein